MQDITDKTVQEKTAMAAIPVVASDNSGVPPTVSIAYDESKLSGVTYDAATKTIGGTPTITNWGATEESREVLITVTATDGANTATDTFVLTVLRDTDGDGTPDTTDPDDDGDGIPDATDPFPKDKDTQNPTITKPEDVTLLEHDPITPIKIAVDDDSYNATTQAGYPTVTLSGLPTGLAYNPETKQVEGTPRVTDWVDNPDISYENFRSFTVTITAMDAAGNKVTETFEIIVNRDTDKDGKADQSADGTINDDDDDNDGIPDDRDSNDKVKDTVAPVISAIPDVTYLENIAIPAPGKQIEAKDESGYMPQSVTVEGLPQGMVFDYQRSGEQGANIAQYITGAAAGTGSSVEGAIVWGATEETRLFPITVTAKDAAGNTSTEKFNITILRDTDGDGIPDTTDPDDDNDGIPDSEDDQPKVADTLVVTVTPEKQTVTEFKPIETLKITENKSATQTLTYEPADVSGLKVEETTNTISGTLADLKWSNDPAAVNYESQVVKVVVASVSGTETDSDTVTITVLRDTDKDGTPDVDDLDDDNDGIPDVDDPAPKVADTTPPKAPVIDNVFTTSTTVTGTGEPGATVTVTFPDNTTGTATVGADGKWTVPVPDGTELALGDTIKATQTDISGNKSPEGTTTVKSMADVYTPLTTRETVELHDINNTYNITNNITNTADLPTGIKVGDVTTTADPAGDVNLDAAGTYTGKIKVEYPDGSSEIVDVPVTVEDTVAPNAPVVNTVVAGATEIKGTGEPGATINKVTVNGTELTLTDPVVVGEDGTWTVPVAGVTLKKDDVIAVTQSDGIWTSPEGKTTVVDMATYYTPTTTLETVERTNPNKTYNITDNITNKANLPTGIIVTDVSDYLSDTPDVNLDVANPAGETYTGKIQVLYPDSSIDVVDVPVKVEDTLKPLAPVIDPIIAHATVITGTGEPGATVSVTIPGVTEPVTATVGEDGKWSVDVPVGTELKGGQTVTATQTDPSGNESPEGTRVVTSMADAYTPTASEETAELGVDFNADGLKDNIDLNKLPDGTTVTNPNGDNVNKDVLGNYEGSVVVTYPDGSSETVPVPVVVKDTTKPAAPVKQDVYNNDKSVSGTGEPGAILTVTFPGGKTVMVQVKEDGTWSVAVPDGVTLTAGEKITATQKDASGNTSDPGETTIKARPMNELYTPTAADEIVELGGTYDLTDNIDRVAQGLPENTTFTDITPEGAIDVNKVGTYTGEILVTYPDNTTDKVTVKVVVKDTTVLAPPAINPVAAMETEVKGTGVPGATVSVYFPGVTEPVKVTVGEDGTWTAPVPSTITLKEGDEIKATQAGANGIASPEATATVTTMEDKYTPVAGKETGEWYNPYQKSTHSKNLNLLDNITNQTDLPLRNSEPVTLKTDVSRTAIGSFTGQVEVHYLDGSIDTVDVPVEIKDTIGPDNPQPNDPYSGAKVLTGTAEEPGGIIEISLAGDSLGNNRVLLGTATVSTTPDALGSFPWTFNVPDGINLHYEGTLINGETKDYLHARQVDSHGIPGGGTSYQVKPLNDLYKNLAATPELVEKGSTYDLTNNVDLTKLPADTVVTDITAENTIDVNKEGDYTGKIKVTFSDGSFLELDVPVTVKDTTPPPAPSIDQPTALDTTITGGDGEPGAIVTVTFPNGETAKSDPVGADGKWTVTVPEGTTLLKDDKITATQQDNATTPNVSQPATATVQSMADKYSPTATDEVLERGTGTINLVDNLVQKDLPLKPQPDGIVATNPTGFDINVVGTYEGDNAGTLTLTYQDGSTDTVPVKVIVQDTQVPAAPEIDPITAGDKTITGTGEPGTTVTVTIPGVDPVTAPVDENGNWTVEVPEGVTLEKGDEVSATISDGVNTSKPSTEVVQSMADKYNPTASRKIVELGGDLAIYTFTDNVDKTKLPTGTSVAFKDNGNIDVYILGEDYYATVTVTYPDNSTEDVKVPVSVRDTTGPGAPIINTVTAGDTTISGTGGEVGSTLVVTFPDGKTAEVEVTDPEGTWSVTVPEGATFKGGDTIKAVQTDSNNNPSETGTTLVQSMAEKFDPTARPESNPVKTEVNDPEHPDGYTVGKVDLILPDGFPSDATFTGTVVDNTKVADTSGTVTITYPDGSTDTVLVPVKVQDTTAPEVSAANAILLEGIALSLEGTLAGEPQASWNKFIDVTDTDNSGIAPKVTAENLPVGLTYNAETKRIEGTPR